jgi:hypothetical protein
MADDDRVKKLMDKSSRLEQQLEKSKKLMSDFKKKLKAAAPEKKEGAGKPRTDDLTEANRELKRQMEEQRKEFEALVGRLNQEIESAQREREELTRLLRLSYQALSNKGAGFEEEPTSAYTKAMEDVIEKEKGAAAEFAEEEATQSCSMEEMLAKKSKDEEE